ncbi:hypothetical protein MCM47_33665, partial [Kitasatospora sp. A2-31]|nr:hypothetical protein [Kitasatospora sp. A2-31]
RIPAGGWANSPGNEPDQATADRLTTFNQHYSDMLYALQDAWADGGTAAIGPAITHMGKMRSTAQQINGIKLPADPRFTYGPEWLFIQR